MKMKLQWTTMVGMLALGAAMLPAIAHADAMDDLTKIQNAYGACLNTSYKQNDMLQCAADAYADADKVLNISYQAMRGRLGKKKGDPAEKSKRLLASERAWIAYRDAECDLQGATDLGGSNEALNRTSCLYEETAVRVKDLEGLFNHPDD